MLIKTENNNLFNRFSWDFDLCRGAAKKGEVAVPKIKPFEDHSSKYEIWFERNKFAYESELIAVKSLLPQKGKGLEIGVGSGRFAAPLGIKMGVEPSNKMKEIAEKRGIQVIKGVAEKLPFDNFQFDFVLMVTTICFVDDIKQALKEAYRVLRNGGSLLIGFIDKDSQIGKIYQMYKEKSVFYKEANFYSTDEVVSILKEVGFKNFNFVQTIFHRLNEVKGIEEIKDGYGEGSFVVIRSTK